MIASVSQSVPLQEVPKLISQLGGFSVDIPLCTRPLLGGTCRNCIGGRGRDLRCAAAAAAATMYESVSGTIKPRFGQVGCWREKSLLGSLMWN